MIQKRDETIFGLILTALFLIALIHTLIHIAVYGTGISGLYKQGMSGFAIGKLELGQEFKSRNPALSPLSKIAIAGEWTILALLLFINLLKNKTDSNPSILELNIQKPVSNKSEIRTDIDVLYNLLKEKKRIKLSLIAKSFNITKEEVMEWCKILESGGLATIEYPKLGEPELALEEEDG